MKKYIILIFFLAYPLFSQNKWEVISQVSPLPKQIRIADKNSWFIALPTTRVWESSKEREIVVSPNLASDYITIQFQISEGLETSEVSSVQIFDMLGILVTQTPSSVNNMKNTQTGASELLRIDVSHLPAGVYFIKITCSNGACSTIEKFVKM